MARGHGGDIMKALTPERTDVPSADREIFEPTPVLVARFGKSIKKAQEQGQLHPDIATFMGVETGTCRCLVCGMLHWHAAEATACCAELIEGPQTEKRSYTHIVRSKRTGIHVTSGPSLAAAVRARCGSNTNSDAERKLGLHLGYLSKLHRGHLNGMAEHTHDILKKLFGGEVPFIEERL